MKVIWRLALTALMCGLFSPVVADTNAAKPGNVEIKTAQPSGDTASASGLPQVSQAQLDTISHKERWLALLHINQGATWHNIGKSYVDDPRFFLAKNGRSDPEAELKASIATLFKPHAPQRCRFVARYRFIAEQLHILISPSAFSYCTDYLAWRKQVPEGKAVLVFPASYLNSPSSMFGHTLLRLDPAKSTGSVWLSQAVSFGAVVNPKDNSILYVYKGLAGGYPGHFTVEPYVAKIQQYSHLENRDMWEYTLTLNHDEISWMVDHLWELKDINFSYYFFDENCSFRLLELLDVARPHAGLLKGFRFAEVPVNTVRTLYGANLVASRHYRPSKAVELSRLAGMLSTSEQKLALQLARHPALTDGKAFQSLPSDRRYLVSRAAYEYLRFNHRKGPRDEGVAKRSYALLRVMNSNQAIPLTPVKTPSPPEQGHDTQMVAVTGGQRDDANLGELEYRFTYHGLLDNSTGFLKGAQIKGFDFRFRYTDPGPLKLEALDVVNIRSLAPRTRFLKPISWFVDGGLQQVDAGGRRRLARYLQGGPGLSWQWADQWQPYAFVTARLESNSAYTQLIEPAAGASVGILHYGRYGEFGLQNEGYYFRNDDYRYRYELTYNLHLGRDNALRVQAYRDGGRDGAVNGWELSWRHYY